jgi:hypothetical protein
VKSAVAAGDDALARFLASLPAADRRALSGLAAPPAVQAFLDTLPYSADPCYRPPRRALRDRKAHCFDGALLAAVALRRLGFPPLILELLPNARDDDHIIALYRVDGRWGAVAKSNFTGLRFREPIHRTVRELVLTYFEPYHNALGEKTLRGYTAPLDLARLDGLDWMGSAAGMEAVAERLDRTRRYALLSPTMEARLCPVDPRALRAGLLGADEAGLWRPE